MVPSSLHDVLIARQSEAELKRKAVKARARGYWVQEEIDYIRRKAKRLADAIKWE